MDCLLDQPMIRLLRIIRILGQAQDEYHNGMLQYGQRQEDAKRITTQISCLTGRSKNKWTGLFR